MQTAEQIRSDGNPRWFILTGLLHDLGKVLCLWSEPQWAVVGDSFPVGCRFSDRIVANTGGASAWSPSAKVTYGLGQRHKIGLAVSTGNGRDLGDRRKGRRIGDARYLGG